MLYLESPGLQSWSWLVSVILVAVRFTINIMTQTDLGQVVAKIQPVKGGGGAADFLSHSFQVTAIAYRYL